MAGRHFPLLCGSKEENKFLIPPKNLYGMSTMAAGHIGEEDAALLELNPGSSPGPRPPVPCSWHPQAHESQYCSSLFKFQRPDMGGLKPTTMRVLNRRVSKC